MKVKRSRPACWLVMLAVNLAMLAEGGRLKRLADSVVFYPSRSSVRISGGCRGINPRPILRSCGQDRMPTAERCWTRRYNKPTTRAFAG